MKRKIFNKIMAFSITTLVLCISISTPAHAEWKLNSIGWWNEKSVGNYSIGWDNISGQWYYFDNNGYMKTGWLNDNGTWYYLNGNGTMASNTSVDGYYLNSNGVWENKVEVNNNISDTTNNTTSNSVNNIVNTPVNNKSDNDLVDDEVEQDDGFNDINYTTITYDNDYNIRMSTNGKDYESDVDENRNPYPRIVVKASDYGFKDGKEMSKKIKYMKIDANGNLTITK